MNKKITKANLSRAEVKKIMKEHGFESELLVVEDRSELNAACERGEITPAEKRKMFGELARNGKMLNTEDGKKYLEVFEPSHFEGASDGPVIAGHSKWTSPLFLQYKKRSEVDETITPGKEWIFTLGNEAEQFVANIGSEMLRANGVMDARYEDCEFGYIWLRYPFVLVHPDGWLVDRKTGSLICMAECKTALKESPHWAEFSTGKVPEDYQEQCIIMMEILSAGGMDINECYVLVWNKTGDEAGFDQLVVKRDSKRAIALLDKMAKFHEDTEAGIYWEDCELKPEEAALLYREENKALGYIELPKKYEKIMRDLDSLTEEEEALKAEIEEPLKDLEEVRKQKKLLKARLYAAIGKAPGATMTVGTKTYSFKVKRSYSLDKDVKEWAENNEDKAIRDAWDKIKEVKPLISMTATVIDAAENTASTDEV